MARYLGVEATDSGKYYFISYNDGDQERVQKYVQLMDKLTVPVWYDYGLKIGAEWETSIAEHIQGCEAVILFVSKNIFKKQKSYVHKEYEMAVNYFNKPIYVVMLDDIKKQEVPVRYVSWWIDLNSLQCVYAYNHEDVTIGTNEIISAIGFVPEKKVKSVKTDTSTQDQPKAKKRGRPSLIESSKQVENFQNKIQNQPIQQAPSVLPINSSATSPEQKQDLPQKILVEKGKGIPTTLLMHAPVQNSGIERISRLIERVYKDELRIRTEVSEVKLGPRIYKFYLEFFNPKLSLSKVLKATFDLKFHLNMQGIRVDHEAGRVFVEVPALNRTYVPLAEVIESKAFNQECKDGLLLPIGESIEGEMFVHDLCKMPHLLIGGATGMGKTVILNSFLVGLMMKYTPLDVRFILFDPKQVEFSAFKNSPFMLFNQIVVDCQMANATLKWLYAEMERRYTLLKENSVYNIEKYNNLKAKKKGEKLHRIVLVVDELADFLVQDRDKFESGIMRLAQKARAVGIHLIIATNRMDAITGIIKANIPTRIALKTATAHDSRTILDVTGAEHLTRSGDILFNSIFLGYERNFRCQSPYVSDKEVANVIAYTNEYYKEEFSSQSTEVLKAVKAEKELPLEVEALRLAIRYQTISIALIQRSLSLGFNQAAELYGWLIENGYVIKKAGKKPVITMTMEQFNEQFKD